MSVISRSVFAAPVTRLYVMNSFGSNGGLLGPREVAMPEQHLSPGRFTLTVIRRNRPSSVPLSGTYPSRYSNIDERSMAASVLDDGEKPLNMPPVRAAISRCAPAANMAPNDIVGMLLPSCGACRPAAPCRGRPGPDSCMPPVISVSTTTRASLARAATLWSFSERGSRSPSR